VGGRFQALASALDNVHQGGHAPRERKDKGGQGEAQG